MAGRSFSAADGGPLDRGAVPGGVAGLDAGAAVEQQADGGGTAGVGGGVQGRAAVVTAGIDGQPGVSGQQAFNRGLVRVLAGGQQPVGAGDFAGGALSHPQPR
jgi:hypothetical protein